MYKIFILAFTILISNPMFSQDLQPSKEIQGKWINSDYEIDVNGNSLIIKNKKSKIIKDIILSFLERPLINKPDQFECWGHTGKFKASVVKSGNSESKDELNEFIYFRLKLKKEKLVFEFSNSLYSNNLDNEQIVPFNIKKIYSEHGYFNNKMKFTR